MSWLEIQEFEEARKDARARRSRLRLAHSAHDILAEAHVKVRSSKRHASWLLPETSVQDEISHYAVRHSALGCRGPHPSLRRQPSKSDSQSVALQIDAAINFAEIGATADPLIKPILLYYSAAQLCGVYTRAVLNWSKDRPSHGLSCQKNSADVGQTQLTVNEKGQFPRLAATCFLLTGRPNVFAELVTYSSQPTAQTGTGELLASFCANEIGIPIAQLSLHDLATFDYAQRLKTVRQHHGFHKFKGLPSTAFLVDVAALFIGSFLARYDVLGWKKILDGKLNSYRLFFDEVFERYCSHTIDVILAAIEDPLGDFSRQINRPLPSPYSHDDKQRFKDDPNYLP